MNFEFLSHSRHTFSLRMRDCPKCKDVIVAQK
jgi:hypothetical protein